MLPNWGSVLNRLTPLIRDTLFWRGRIRRGTFYKSIGGLYVVGLLTLPLHPMWWRTALPEIGVLVLGLIGVALGGAMFAFLLGAVVRRLHDRGRSGWWLLVFFGPHLLAVAAIDRIPPIEQQRIMFGVLITFVLAGPFLAWGMAEILLLGGVRGANKYGPDTRAISDAEPVAPAA